MGGIVTRLFSVIFASFVEPVTRSFRLKVLHFTAPKGIAFLESVIWFKVVERLIAVSETRSDKTECRVGDALSSMSEIIMGDLDAAGISLQIAGDLDLCAMIGRAELSQALVQLVQNAMEASHDHGKIKIDIQLRDDTVVIMVEDDGHGIEPEAQPKVFDAFFTTRLGRNASGLGLTITHRIVHQVDGKVSLVSPKSPTRFEVVLKSA